MNMFALWMFGMELENIWGSQKFMAYYLMCGVGAGLANLLIAPLFAAINVPTIGASGAVYGVLVAFGMLFPDRPIYLYFLFPIKAKYFVAIYMVIEVLSVGSNTGVAHFAHLGGGLIGFIYLMLTKNNINSLFRFNKKPSSLSFKKPASIYRNKYYCKFCYCYSYCNTQCQWLFGHSRFIYNHSKSNSGCCCSCKHYCL